MSEATGAGASRPLSVLSLQLGADTGGGGYRLHRAFARHAPTWSVRSMVASQNYIEYPIDLPYRSGSAQRLFEEVDVVHLHNQFAGLSRMERMAERRRRRARPPMVMHHHGTALRGPLDGSTPDDWRAFAAPILAEQQARDAIGVVSTVDLSVLHPALTWMPTPYDLDWLASLRHAGDPARVVVAHAPTSRMVKSTHVFIAAMDRIMARHPHVSYDLIEQVSWNECLRRKAAADVFYDQMILGYGNNAIEAWGMGIPVIAGVEFGEVRERMTHEWGDLPFAEATVDSLEHVIEDMVCDVGLREFYARLGRRHVERFHDERVVVRNFQSVYRRAVQGGVADEEVA